jgi:hypothetical protein
MQAFQPAVLSDASGAVVVPVLMVAVAVAAFGLANVFAFMCSMVILSAFSASLFVLALGRLMAISTATLCDLQFWRVFLHVIEAAVDINALLDASVCGVGISSEDNNLVIVVLLKKWCDVGNRNIVGIFDVLVSRTAPVVLSVGHGAAAWVCFGGFMTYVAN